MLNDTQSRVPKTIGEGDIVSQLRMHTPKIGLIYQRNGEKWRNSISPNGMSSYG